MSLHSSDYIQDVIGHVPSAMLSLRSDEVSVFSRMNVQGRRRISLPAKLAGITEKVQSDNSDVQESLQDSYSQMKSKLDQLEEYNQKLEEQLSNIFTSISNTVNKAEKSNDLSFHRNNVENIIGDEGCEESEQGSDMFKPFVSPANVKSDSNQFDSARYNEVRHNKLILHLEEENFIFPNLSRSKIPVLPELGETQEFKTAKEQRNVIEEDAELDCFPNYKRGKGASEYINMRGLYKNLKNSNQTYFDNLDRVPTQLTKKPPQPVNIKKTQRSKSTGESTFTLISQSAERFPIKYKQNTNNKISVSNRKTSALGLNGSEHNQSCELPQQENKRRFSSVDNPIFPKLSEIKRREDSRRRISMPKKRSSSEHKLEHRLRSTCHIRGNIEELDYNQNILRKSNSTDQNYSTPQRPPSMSLSLFKNKSSTTSSVATSIGENIEKLSKLPPAYLTFHDESESVDEFFLFSEDVLKINCDTVWEELSIFSKDMGRTLKSSDKKSYSLKATQASNKWKTLWIHRGM